MQDIAFQTKVQITDIYVALAGVKKEYDGTSEAASYLPYYSAAQIKSLGKKDGILKKHGENYGKMQDLLGFLECF